MSDKLVVEVNGQVAVAYARKPIPGRQRKYIDALEEDMSEGISLLIITCISARR